MRLLALLTAGLFVGAALADDKKEKVKDEEAILGTWEWDKIDSGNSSDKQHDTFFKELRYTLQFQKDGKWTVAVRGIERKDASRKYKLDPTAKLKHFDMIYEDGTECPGLYELDGDTLKLCIYLSEKDQKFTRPTEFKADDKAGVIVLTLKRVKEEKKEEEKDK